MNRNYLLKRYDCLHPITLQYLHPPYTLLTPSYTNMLYHICMVMDMEAPSATYISIGSNLKIPSKSRELLNLKTFIMALYREVFSTSQEIINIQLVIDTDAITNDYPNPSKDKNQPTGLPHKYMYMVATRGDVITGSGGADLVIKADVGDIIRWYVVSEYGNFDSAVVIYNLPKWSGETVFNDPTFSVYKRQGILPKTHDVSRLILKPQIFGLTSLK
jgi:hypothetical protein